MTLPIEGNRGTPGAVRITGEWMVWAKPEPGIVRSGASRASTPNRRDRPWQTGNWYSLSRMSPPPTPPPASKDSGIADGDAIGILALDADGKLKQDKVGARSTGTGAAIGGVIAVFSTALLGPAVLAGTAVGALHRKNLGLSDGDKAGLTAELQAGKAASRCDGPFRHGVRDRRSPDAARWRTRASRGHRRGPSGRGSDGRSSGLTSRRRARGSTSTDETPERFVGGARHTASAAAGCETNRAPRPATHCLSQHVPRIGRTRQRELTVKTALAPKPEPRRMDGQAASLGALRSHPELRRPTYDRWAQPTGERRRRVAGSGIILVG
jgi:hypothetical protein